MKLVVLNTLKLFLVVVLVALTFVLWAFSITLSTLPTRSSLMKCMKTSMFGVNLCPGGPDYVKLDKISSYLMKAVVLTEDSSFYDHSGFDFKEIQKSLEKNMKSSGYARGGSTITQQLAKNLFLSGEKSMLRKVKEGLYAYRLERSLSKKEILERYLNVVQFGPDIFGVKAASSFYFKKSPAEISLLEAAFLAFLLPSPERYSVSFFKRTLTPFALKRLKEILESMHRYNRVTDSEYANALAKIGTFSSDLAYQKTPTDFDMSLTEEEVEPSHTSKAPTEEFEVPLEKVPELPESVNEDGI